MAGAVVVKHVSKGFRDIARGADVHALDDVSCAIADQEFAAILGPSGCGKSTLLNILAGFEAPSTGEVLLDGRPITQPGPDRGVVFQEYALFPWLSVVQNIEFGLRHLSLGTGERRVRVERYVELVGLQGFEHRFPKELSGGMRQRVALARVLAVDPEVLLLDEPFAALDALTRQLLQKELLRIWTTTRKTVLLVTHSIDEALILADRLYVMSAGPGRILEMIQITLPRPRDLASADLNVLRGRVNHLIEQEVMRAFEERARAE